MDRLGHGEDHCGGGGRVDSDEVEQKGRLAFGLFLCGQLSVWACESATEPRRCPHQKAPPHLFKDNAGSEHIHSTHTAEGVGEGSGDGEVLSP